MKPKFENFDFLRDCQGFRPNIGARCQNSDDRGQKTEIRYGAIGSQFQSVFCHLTSVCFFLTPET